VRARGESPTHRNPEGIAWDDASRTFFVGAFNAGTIYRGGLDDPTVRPFVEGSPGRSAVGLKVAAGRLYVAGGIYGDLKVYDVATKAQVGTFTTGQGGFLNDLVVTDTGDVWVTDSVRPMLWHLTPRPRAGNQRRRRPADRRKPARRRQFRRSHLLTLDSDARTATAAGKIEDPSFRAPSTVANADSRYLVVNADFSKSRSPFTVSSVTT
jgi:hypothetical protein